MKASTDSDKTPIEITVNITNQTFIHIPSVLHVSHLCSYHASAELEGRVTKCREQILAVRPSRLKTNGQKNEKALQTEDTATAVKRERLGSHSPPFQHKYV